MNLAETQIYTGLELPPQTTTPLSKALGHAKGRLSYDESCAKIAAATDGKYKGFRNFIDVINAESGSSMIIVGGGASLKETLIDIKLKTRISKRWQIMACNKSHDFLFKNGLGSKIAYATMCDPAEWISDYIEPRRGVKYLLASQLHDKTLDKFLPFKNSTFIWHTEGIFSEAPKGIFGGVATPVTMNVREWFEKTYPGVQAGFFGRNASCIGMLALFEAVVMGCSEVELHGFDSCYLPDRSDLHAYPKPKTTSRLVDVTVKSKRTGDTLRFVTNPEMSRQALEFGNMIEGVNNREYLGGNWNTVTTVAGDGVIPWLAWKDGGRFFKHADPSEMQRQYGNAKEVDIRPSWALNENGETKVFI